MSWENTIGIMAVVLGAILGYLASYLNNHQQRKWQLDNDYRSWKRANIEKDMALMFDFIQRYTTLAHGYVEFTHSPDDPLLRERHNHTKANAVEQLKNEKPFPISLKSGATAYILDELDKVTDCVVEIVFNDKKPQNEVMDTQLERLRELEKLLNIERQKLMEATFK